MLTEQFQASVSLPELRTVVSCMWSLAKRVGLQGSLERSLSPEPSSAVVHIQHASVRPPCDTQAEHAEYEVKEIEVLVQVDSCYICDVNLFLCFDKISTLCYIWEFGWSVYKSVIPSKFVCFNVGSGQVLLALLLSIWVFSSFTRPATVVCS